MRYRSFITAGCLIAACHSGETRDPLAIDLADDGPSDSGSDAAVPNGFSGSSGASGNGGNPDHSTSGTGGADAGSSSSGATAGSAVEDAGNGDVDIPDSSSVLDGSAAVSDAEAGVDVDASDEAGSVEAGLSCGDGTTDLALDEECDDGNRQHSDGCELDCTKTRIVQIALGRTANCALSSGGGVKCWGQDVYGYLARGTLGVDVNDPLQAEVYDFGTTRRVIQIATNRYHVCVLFEDGRARCWGNNEQGQLGDGTQQNFGDDSTEILSERPDLSLTHIKSITAGRDGTCAISDVSGSDKVYCWGANARGEVGIASGADRVLNPSGQPITLNTVPKAVIGNQYSYCALLATNVARCWGTYLKGVRGMGVTNYDLGDNETPSSNAFNVQGVPNPISQLAGSYFTNCAISNGDLYCWGGNLNSEAGYPNASYGDEIWQTPGKVNLGDVSLVQASVTDQYGCGVDDEGVVRCWGSNLDDGALGYPYVYRVGYAREPATDYQLMHDALLDGGSPDSGVTPGLPIGAVDLGDFDETPGLDRAVRVEAGYHRTCALMEGGTLRCWGQNSYGTVGYAEAGEFIGLTDSPAQAYRQIGYSDVKVFGPPSDP